MPYVVYVVDDALCGRRMGADMNAVIRERGEEVYESRLVGWKCEGEPLFVAVHSYLNVFIEDAEAEELAADYLEEIGWCGENGGRRGADYIL
jgi:hypothetical protein